MPNGMVVLHKLLLLLLSFHIQLLWVPTNVLLLLLLLLGC